jgi:PKD repeat protein
MKQPQARRAALGAIIAAVVGVNACTMKSQEAPPLAGPSEFGTSISITVSPDLLTQDGASQSLVTITARDPNGAPVRNVSLRAEIAVGGVRADFGTISARNLVTDSAGRATLVYTAPAIGNGPAVDTGTVVEILVTPVGTDYGNSATRSASIRLVPPGIVVPPDGLSPKFTFTPAAPTDHQGVLFDASTSTAPSNNPIAGYSWDFGDGATGSGITATHSYSAAGTYFVKLTVSDSIGRAASTAQSISIAAGTGPTVVFTFSPSAPQVGQIVNFNASATRPTAGRTISSYAWNFGDGDSKTTSAPQTTHDFQSAGAFTVTLVVTDDAGRTGSATNTVTVGAGAPTPNFSVSPTDPTTADTVSFNASASTPSSGRTIVSYQWDFGDSSSGTGVIATHRFLAARTYTVTLTVTDDAGRSAITSKTVTIR